MESVRCSATNRKGARCGKFAIPGGTVCRMHGGGAPQVIAKAQERMEACAERVLEELCHVSFVDIREAFDKNNNLIDVKNLPDRVARAISGVEYEDVWETDKDGKQVKVGRTAKIKMWDKLGGLDKIARHVGLYAADKTPEGASAGTTIQLVVVQAGASSEGKPVLDIMSLVKE